MATRVSHFDFDWWIIQKRAVHIAALILVLCVMAGGVALYVWKYGNPLRNVALHSAPMAGARVMSFGREGGGNCAAPRPGAVATTGVQAFLRRREQRHAHGGAPRTEGGASTAGVRANTALT